MSRSAPFRSLVLLGLLALAGPAAAQGWGMVDTEGGAGAGAFVCATPGEAEDDAPCFRLTCENDAPLHYEIALFDAVGVPEDVAVEVRIDGRPSGLLLFERGAQAEGMTDLAAPFDPRLHRDLVDKLRRGNGAELIVQRPEGAITAALSLKGSSKALGAVMDACPMPEVPLNDPAAVVLDEIVRECGSLGGSVAMEPGFERREDLDGDGREDVVIDYAAAVCSEMASLYCGSGGCTVGFFLSRDEGFKRIYDGVIRGYAARPGGLLALDLHGTACGLYGFEACRKVFRIADDSFALVEEMTGAAAEAPLASEAVTPEPQPEAAAQAAAPEDTAQTDSAPATALSVEADAGKGLVRLGDDGAMPTPEAGERLPDDLAPAEPETIAPAGAGAD